MRDKENNELHLTGLFSVFSFANLIKPYTSEVGSGPAGTSMDIACPVSRGCFAAPGQITSGEA